MSLRPRKLFVRIATRTVHTSRDLPTTRTSVAQMSAHFVRRNNYNRNLNPQLSGSRCLIVKSAISESPQSQKLQGHRRLRVRNTCKGQTFDVIIIRQQTPLRFCICDVPRQKKRRETSRREIRGKSSVVSQKRIARARRSVVRDDYDDVRSERTFGRSRGNRL